LLRLALRRRAVSDAAALNRFLVGVEKRAFRMARFAVRNTDDALDIVQDSMLTLARKYSAKPEGEWAPLFFRILNNRITDWHRRTRVRRSVFGVLGLRDDDGEPVDPASLAVGGPAGEPEFATQMSAATVRLEKAVSDLPERQREAFLLRIWEGLDVAATAVAMRCSEGSVKTHLSRAIHRLRGELQDDWP
jgi:RNA polymerase sigma-70 factor (ECF subfamily)